MKNMCLWLISVGKTQKDYYLQKHSVGKKNREGHLNDVTILVFVWLRK